MIERRQFGRTGHASSRVIFGAAALGGMTQERANATLELITDAGINHIDTAASYGESELRLAPWLSDYRSKVFLATKTGIRTGPEARVQLEDSLTRLGVDSVDLIQLHNLVEQEDFDTAHGSGGVVEAMVKARDEGLVRFIGVTGHGTRIAGMHSRSLERFPFDSVLLPYNFAMLENPMYRADVGALLETCVERRVAVQTIKAVARRRWPTVPDRRFSWYEALDDAEAIGRAVRHVLGHSQLFLNTTSDARLVPTIIAASQGSPTAPSDEEMQADLVAYNITPLFDGAELEVI